MTKKYNVPWEIGSLFICTKCGAKYNQPELAEELKSALRKDLKGRDENSKVRVMTSGCLNICYPEEQTFVFMPKSGDTEVYTSTLDKQIAYDEIKEFLKTKMTSSS